MWSCTSSAVVNDDDVLDVSAGVGRTGVFIALSIVLERMRYEGVVDLYQTVKLLRTQRQGMIQSEVRYMHVSVQCTSVNCRSYFSFSRIGLRCSYHVICDTGTIHTRWRGSQYTA